MKTKKSPKRLALSRATLRQLATADLPKVSGGSERVRNTDQVGCTDIIVWDIVD